MDEPITSVIRNSKGEVIASVLHSYVDESICRGIMASGESIIVWRDLREVAEDDDGLTIEDALLIVKDRIDVMYTWNKVDERYNEIYELLRQAIKIAVAIDNASE